MPNVMNLFRLNGRRALVTGGAKGLGLVMATALAEAGADVAITSRAIGDAQSAAERTASSTGRHVIGLSADVLDPGGIDRLAAEAQAQLGPIDILINNAGINIRGPAEKLSESDWDAVLDTNLKAPFLLSKALGPAMAERNWGRIINLGSIMSVVAMSGRGPYAASKAGLLGLTRALGLEWASRGVTVNAICPGPFGTEMNRPLLDNPDAYKAFVAKVPMGRWGELHEVAGAVVFLASDAASYVTGSALFIDGGWTAQ